MPSPFPGMDPYLEESLTWRTVHGALLTNLMSQLNATLPEGLMAVIEDRVVISLPQRQVAIRTIRGELVTVIEVLSPTNKRSGKDQDEYKNKQSELLANDVHLLEIDLLRGGEYTVAVSLEDVEAEGAWDYVVCLHYGGTPPRPLLIAAGTPGRFYAARELPADLSMIVNREIVVEPEETEDIGITKPHHRFSPREPKCDQAHILGEKCRQGGLDRGGRNFLGAYPVSWRLVDFLPGQRAQTPQLLDQALLIFRCTISDLIVLLEKSETEHRVLFCERYFCRWRRNVLPTLRLWCFVSASWKAFSVATRFRVVS